MPPLVVRRVINTVMAPPTGGHGHGRPADSTTAGAPAEDGAHPPPLVLQDSLRLTWVLVLALPAGDCIGAVALQSDEAPLSAESTRSIGGLIASVVQFLGERGAGEAADGSRSPARGGGPRSPASRAGSSSAPSRPRRGPSWIKTDKREFCVLVENGYVLVGVCEDPIKAGGGGPVHPDAPTGGATSMEPRFAVETVLFRAPDLANVLEHAITKSRSTAIEKAEGYTVESMLQAGEEELFPERRATDSMLRLLFLKDICPKTAEGLTRCFDLGRPFCIAKAGAGVLFCSSPTAQLLPPNSTATPSADVLPLLLRKLLAPQPNSDTALLVGRHRFSLWRRGAGRTEQIALVIYTHPFFLLGEVAGASGRATGASRRGDDGLGGKTRWTPLSAWISYTAVEERDVRSAAALQNFVALWDLWFEEGRVPMTLTKRAPVEALDLTPAVGAKTGVAADFVRRDDEEPPVHVRGEDDFRAWKVAYPLLEVFLGSVEVGALRSTCRALARPGMLESPKKRRAAERAEAWSRSERSPPGEPRVSPSIGDDHSLATSPPLSGAPSALRAAGGPEAAAAGASPGGSEGGRSSPRTVDYDLLRRNRAEREAKLTKRVKMGAHSRSPARNAAGRVPPKGGTASAPVSAGAGSSSATAGSVGPSPPSELSSPSVLLLPGQSPLRETTPVGTTLLGTTTPPTGLGGAPPRGHAGSPSPVFAYYPELQYPNTREVPDEFEGGPAYVQASHMRPDSSRGSSSVLGPRAASKNSWLSEASVRSHVVARDRRGRRWRTASLPAIECCQSSGLPVGFVAAPDHDGPIVISPSPADEVPRSRGRSPPSRATPDKRAVETVANSWMVAEESSADDLHSTAELSKVRRKLVQAGLDASRIADTPRGVCGGGDSRMQRSKSVGHLVGQRRRGRAGRIYYEQSGMHPARQYVLRPLKGPLPKIVTSGADVDSGGLPRNS